MASGFQRGPGIGPWKVGQAASQAETLSVCVLEGYRLVQMCRIASRFAGTPSSSWPNGVADFRGRSPPNAEHQKRRFKCKFDLGPISIVDTMSQTRIRTYERVGLGIC